MYSGLTVLSLYSTSTQIGDLFVANFTELGMTLSNEILIVSLVKL